MLTVFLPHGASEPIIRKFNQAAFATAERVGLILLGKREIAAGEGHEPMARRIDSARPHEAIVEEHPA